MWPPGRRVCLLTLRSVATSPTVRAERPYSDLPTVRRRRLVDAHSIPDAGDRCSDCNVLGCSADYTHLLLVINSELSGTAATQAVTAQFNGDTAADYTGGFILNALGTVTGSSAAGATSIDIGASGPTGGSTQAIISGYASSSIVKSATGSGLATTASGITQLNGAGTWNATAAITSITLTAAAGSFIAGSTFSLYGMQ